MIDPPGKNFRSPEFGTDFQIKYAPFGGTEFSYRPPNLHANSISICPVVFAIQASDGQTDGRHRAIASTALAQANSASHTSVDRLCILFHRLTTSLFHSRLY